MKKLDIVKKILHVFIVLVWASIFIDSAHDIYTGSKDFPLWGNIVFMVFAVFFIALYGFSLVHDFIKKK